MWGGRYFGTRYFGDAYWGKAVDGTHFGNRYWGGNYFGQRYWGTEIATTPPVVAEPTTTGDGFLAGQERERHENRLQEDEDIIALIMTLHERRP